MSDVDLLLLSILLFVVACVCDASQHRPASVALTVLSVSALLLTPYPGYLIGA